MIEPSFWAGKRVLVTGHTGFKGSWLALWLEKLGARVTGVALDPPFVPNLFELASLETRIESVKVDVADLSSLTKVFREHKPEIVIHLAAQSLVRQSYVNPYETYRTNVLGSLAVLEATRKSGSVAALVNVTTDKCYENAEWEWPYRETDPLGGYDLYSSSKAASEIMTSSYRRSFFNPQSYGQDHRTLVATARAGNVIGGGDWSTDRLLPDCFRAIQSKGPLAIRNPDSIRPWQHVLEPIGAYLLIAQKLFQGDKRAAEAWNIGPADGEARSVGWMVDRLARRFPALQSSYSKQAQPHEAQYLRLDCSKVRQRLGWRPVWTTELALDRTADWFESYLNGQNIAEFTTAQIDEYLNDSRNT